MGNRLYTIAMVIATAAACFGLFVWAGTDTIVANTLQITGAAVFSVALTAAINWLING